MGDGFLSPDGRGLKRGRKAATLGNNFQQIIGGLYVVTPDERDTAELLRKVRMALSGGARAVQYRNKLADAPLRLEQASALRALTRQFSVQFIINDDVTLAVEADADGVHLGAEDGSLSEARARLGQGRLIGASCYNRHELAMGAARQGADYVAFGSFFASAVKPEAVAATPELLRRARQELTLPIVAIGGITAQNGPQLLKAGADALAVISAVFASPDIEGAAKEFSNLFDQGKTA